MAEVFLCFLLCFFGDIALNLCLCESQACDTEPEHCVLHV